MSRFTAVETYNCFRFRLLSNVLWFGCSVKAFNIPIIADAHVNKQRATNSKDVIHRDKPRLSSSWIFVTKISNTNSVDAKPLIVLNNPKRKIVTLTQLDK